MSSHFTKIVVVGDKNTGKTSFITKYLYNIFLEDYVETSATEVYCQGCYLKIIDFIPDSNGMEVNWGYGGCDGVIIVYDVHNQDSYDNIDNWINNARRCTKSPIIICGTMSDMPGGKIYHNDEIPTFIVSAKTGASINTAGEYLLKQIKINNPSKFY
jgi:GTPase SAR1 family protein